MNVPFVDLNAQYNDIKSEIDSALKRVFKNGRYIGGPEVEAFERKFAQYIGTRQCVGVNSGTDALILGTRALGLVAGDEMIIPVNTFYSSVLAALENGLKPVFADIDPRDNGYDLSDVQRKLTSRTKAIMAVHLYGQPEKMSELTSLIKRAGRKIYIIEDAAQSHGASYNKKKTGSFGIFAGFSFYPSKNLGAYGDGGAITSNDASLMKKIGLLHEYGQTNKYHHDTIGVNSRLDSLQAAVLTVKLKHLDRWNKKRQALAKQYSQLLHGVGDVRLPMEDPIRPSTYHIYAIRTSRRAGLQRHLAKRGIVTQIHYPRPLHMQKAFGFLQYKKGDFPAAEKVAGELLSLPIYPELTHRQITFVVKHIIEFFRS